MKGLTFPDSKKLVKVCKVKMANSLPDVAVATGVVGIIFGVVSACKATLKADEVIDKFEEAKNKIVEAKEIAGPNEYTDDDAKHDLTIAYINLVKDYGKLYWKPAVAIASSIGLIIWSHGKVKQKAAALGCLTEAINADFSAYRDAVKEKYGEDIDREFRYGIKKEKVEKEITDEKGKIKKIKEDISVIENDRLIGSPYARFFDETSREYDPHDPEHNLFFLNSQQNYMNDRLHAEGIILLNDVYDALDLPRSSAGAHVGWIDGSENGDSFIDFGIFNVHRKENREFVNGLEPCILLDFNVDGVVDDKIDEIIKFRRG